METSVAVARHDNHNQRFKCGSFRGINCRASYRAFTDDGNALSFSHSLKTPLKDSRKKPRSTKAMSVPTKIDLHGANYGAFKSEAGLVPTPLESRSFSPRTPPLLYVDDGVENSIRNATNGAVSGWGKLDFGRNDDRFCFSERWAGPAYSNSPAPSTLPLPKFSQRAKGILPSSSSDIDLHHIAKSAADSPTRRSLTFDVLDNAADSATKTLRRILNLDE